MSGFSSPAITRSVVVLPAPDGPSRTKNAPSGMSSCSALSASTSPNDLWMSWRDDRGRHPVTPFVIETCFPGGALTTCSLCGS